MRDARHPKFAKPIDFLPRILAANVNGPLHVASAPEKPGGLWWVKFSLDIDHDRDWHGEPDDDEEIDDDGACTGRIGDDLLHLALW